MKDLQRKLGAAAPAIVRVLLADGETRDLRPATGTRKRWAIVLDMVSRLEWRRMELLDAKGGLLDMLDNPEAAPAQERDRFGGDDPSDRMLKRMIDAQREALTWQDKSVRAALDTCVQVMRQMGDATAALTDLFRMERDSMRAMMRDLEHAAQAAQGTDGDLPSTELLKAMAPLLLSKLAAGAKPSNGT